MLLELRERMLEGPGGTERPLTKDEMIAYARSVDLAQFDCGGLTAFNEARYARNTVCENEHFELVLICWRPGQASAIHDHGSSYCLYLVIEGALEEGLYELGPDGEPVHTRTRTWHSGEITVAAGDDVHQIRNNSEQDLRTLHIYSPPLKQTSKNYTPVPRTA
jgi:cysteine dioxygenase